MKRGKQDNQTVPVKQEKAGKSEKPGKKGLSVWQLTMLALGTVVGGSFFLGSSVAIRAAGPSVLLAYVIGGGLVYLILSALSEMTVANPAPGSFRTYTEQAFGRGAGFTVGWALPHRRRVIPELPFRRLSGGRSCCWSASIWLR